MGVTRNELLNQADMYYHKERLNQLEDYKKKLINDLEQFKNIETMNMLDLLNSLNLARRIETEIQDIEYWYGDKKDAVVEKAANEVRDILSCYQEVESFANCLDGFKSLFQVDEYLTKVKTNAEKEEIENRISKIESRLKEQSIIEKEKIVARRVSEDEKVYVQKIPAYRAILVNNLKDLRNMENLSVGKFLRTLEVADEVKEAVGIMDIWYQELEDPEARMHARDLEEILDIYQDYKVLIPYLKGEKTRTKIKDYIEASNQTIVGREFAAKVVALNSKLEEREEDEYIESAYEKVLDAEIVDDEIPIMEKEHDDRKEKVIDSTYKEEVAEEKTTESFVAKEKITVKRRVESETIQKDVVEDEEAKERRLAEELLSKRIKAVEEQVESVDKAKKAQEEEKEREIARKATEKENIKDEDEDEEFLINLMTEEAMIKNTTNEKKEDRKAEDRTESKLVNFQKYLEERKAFYIVKMEYLSQVKSLRDQLKNDLAGGLTFHFFRKYNDQYYQTRLKRIHEKMVDTYGEEIVKKLENTKGALQTTIREINCKLNKIKSDFHCLLETKITSLDGNVSTLSSMENLTGNEFYIIRETIPVLVTAIEKNMKATLKGKKVIPIKLRGLESYVSYEKPTKKIIRNSSYHYDTCKMLSETIPEGISVEELDQICQRLNKSLRNKKKIQEDNSDLWFAYKSSVENLNSCVRSLKRASNDEREGILQKISKLSSNYVKAYMEKNHEYNTSFIQDIKNFFSEMKESIMEVLFEKENDFEYGYDYMDQEIDQESEDEFYMENNFSDKIMRDDDLLFLNLDNIDIEDIDLETAEVNSLEQSKDDASRINNLKVGDSIKKDQNFSIVQDTPNGHLKRPITEVATVQSKPLITLDQLEQIIRQLARGEEINEYTDATEAFQKAI